MFSKKNTEQNNSISLLDKKIEEVRKSCELFGNAYKLAKETEQKAQLQHDEAEQKRMEYLEKNNRLKELSIIEKSKIIDVVINSLKQNTNEQWEYIEKVATVVVEKGYIDNYDSEPDKYATKVIGFFKPRSYIMEENRGFGGKYERWPIYMKKPYEDAKDGKVIILNSKQIDGRQSPTMSHISLWYTWEYGKKSEDGLYINSDFYMEKYPFLKDALKELIILNMRYKI